MYSNRAITAEDISIWIDDFTKATEVIGRMEEGLPGDRYFLKSRIKDAMFLIAYAESTLAAEVGDEVYGRAIELQKAFKKRGRVMNRIEATYLLNNLRVFGKDNSDDEVIDLTKVRQADTLIIAAALRDFAQDNERNISDKERAEELREQVLAYGASMCQPKSKLESDLISRQAAIEYIDNYAHLLTTGNYFEGMMNAVDLLKRLDLFPPVTPTERTGEWTNTGVLTVHCSNCKSEFHELEAMNYCPNCGAKMGGDTE